MNPNCIPEMGFVSMFCLKETPPSTSLKPFQKNHKIQIGIFIELLMMLNLSFYPLQLGIFVHINREANYFVHNLASWACAYDFDRPISISSIPNLLFVSGDDLVPSDV